MREVRAYAVKACGQFVASCRIQQLMLNLGNPVVRIDDEVPAHRGGNVDSVAVQHTRADEEVHRAGELE
jgi:hypothetical protein